MSAWAKQLADFDIFDTRITQWYVEPMREAGMSWPMCAVLLATEIRVSMIQHPPEQRPAPHIAHAYQRAVEMIRQCYGEGAGKMIDAATQGRFYDVTSDYVYDTSAWRQQPRRKPTDANDGTATS